MEEDADAGADAVREPGWDKKRKRGAGDDAAAVDERARDAEGKKKRADGSAEATMAKDRQQPTLGTVPPPPPPRPEDAQQAVLGVVSPPPPPKRGQNGSNEQGLSAGGESLDAGAGDAAGQAGDEKALPGPPQPPGPPPGLPPPPPDADGASAGGWGVIKAIGRPEADDAPLPGPDVARKEPPPPPTGIGLVVEIEPGVNVHALADKVRALEGVRGVAVGCCTSK